MIQRRQLIDWCNDDPQQALWNILVDEKYFLVNSYGTAYDISYGEFVTENHMYGRRHWNWSDQFSIYWAKSAQVDEN